MLTPPRISLTNSFSPIGHTPAVNLTRSLPQGADADILLLGCSDVRNILFTVYSEKGFPPRKLDITCCDTETAIIARNVLLFTFLIDGVDPDRAWDIYFHLRISEESEKLIKEQSQKIISVSTDIDRWSKSRYGSMLRFHDATSLQEVREIWVKYGSTQSNAEDRFEESLQLTRKTCKLDTGGPPEHAVLDFRSAAPLSIRSKEVVLQAKQYFWTHGNFSKQSGTVPNPMFSTTMSADTYLDYYTDPLLGFHLAAGVVNLAPASPLRPNEGSDEILNVVAAAKTQFREWVSAFKETPEDRIALRFTVSDPFSFSYTLRAVAIPGSKPACRQQDNSTAESDPKTYNAENSAPTRFDVIDTSNLGDRLGLLNILVAAAPLLKKSASSTLWRETLVETGQMGEQQLDALLCGHASTMSLLLGLVPVDFWTNATSTSYVDELILNYFGSNDHAQKTHLRLAWKLNTSFSQQTGGLGTLYVDPQALSKTVFQIYTAMFAIEGSSTFPNHIPLETMRKLRNTYFHFHRGSFAALLKNIRANTSTSWSSFWEDLLQMITQDGKEDKICRQFYRQELAVQLHLQGLLTEKWLEDNTSSNPDLGGFHAWKDVPAVVCITVVVPKELIDDVFNTRDDVNYTPVLEGVLKSSDTAGWQAFACVRMVFGDIETSGNREADDFSIIVHQDPLGLKGESPLVMSFYVPSAALQKDPTTAQAGLWIKSILLNVRSVESLPLEAVVYKTKIRDASSVFITRYEPGKCNYPFAGSREDGVAQESAIQASTSTATRITANFEDNKIISLCGHVDFSSEQVRKLLAEHVSIELQQSSPFSIDIVFGKRITVHTVAFPIPVLKETAKTRIARTSGYVEVIAPLADPLSSGPLSSFIYPVAPGKGSVPVLLNCQNVNLDSLPILDVDQFHEKQDRWLSVLVSNQFSNRERRLRDSTEPASLRMNFKESIFTIFMLATGLQGGNTGLFVLQHPENGNQILVFVRAIRLNGAEASVVADAAVIPITRHLIDSGKLESFLYILRELEICALTVDDEELVLWKKVLPALAERCRTWSHGPNCEYKSPGATIPLSTEMGKQFMCSCGNGKLPKNFISLPDWDGAASDYAVRVAISPTFSVPLVEDVVDLELLHDQKSLESSFTDKCRNCNATEAKNGGNLLRCSRCREVMYCSAECQRKDWKKHRMECKAYDAS